jgi:type II secretory pathway component PulF
MPMVNSNQNMYLRLGFLPALIVFGLAFWAVPSFIEIYDSFGAELPAASRFLFSWYRVLAFVPFLFLLAWFFWPHRNVRGLASMLVSLVLSAWIIIFGVWAAYKPLFILGSTQ